LVGLRLNHHLLTIRSYNSWLHLGVDLLLRYSFSGIHRVHLSSYHSHWLADDDGLPGHSRTGLSHYHADLLRALRLYGVRRLLILLRVGVLLLELLSYLLDGRLRLLALLQLSLRLALLLGLLLGLLLRLLLHLRLLGALLHLRLLALLR